MNVYLYGGGSGTGGYSYNLQFENIPALDYLRNRAKSLLRDTLARNSESPDREKVIRKFNRYGQFPTSFQLNVYEKDQSHGIVAHRDSDAIFGTAVYVHNETNEGPLTVSGRRSASSTTGRDIVLLDPNAVHYVPAVERNATRYSIQVMF